jgi:NADH-quinone oxidoreductase subunit J
VTFELALFFVVAIAAVASAVLMILQRNPVMSAIYLIGNFFCLALLYLMLSAQLLAVLQIIVYTGAIMVLVVFVIMLLNLGDEKKLAERYDIKRIIGVVAVIGFLLEMLFIFGFSGGSTTLATAGGAGSTVGTVEQMGQALFGTYLLPFEVTSLLLLAAIIGAVILAKRKI